jgi:hypothetical protein
MSETIEDVKYVTNPDIIIREEDHDGALLFNPDTNDVKVINSTGSFIWRICQEERMLSDIIDAVKDNFEQVPSEKIEIEVKDFIEALVETEFIGTIE